MPSAAVDHVANVAAMVRESVMTMGESRHCRQWSATGCVWWATRL